MNKIKTYFLITIVCFCVLEFLLQIMKPLFVTLPINIATILLTPYVPDAKSGIYLSDISGYGCKRMKPNFSLECYFNGYIWHHETNENGFRDEKGISVANIILLGDSLVYGHALESNNTLSTKLSEFLGKKVANLGVGGTSTLEHYIYFRNQGVYMKPLLVIVMPHASDGYEAFDLLGFARGEKFLSSAVNDYSDDFSEPKLLSIAGRSFCYERIYNIMKNDLILLRILSFIKGKIVSFRRDYYNFNDQKIRFGIKLNLHALKKINSLCKVNGVKLLVVCHPHFKEFTQIIEEFCRKESIAFYNYGPMLAKLESELGMDKIYLKNDGHFTAFANNRIARHLAEFITRKCSKIFK